MTYKNFYGTKAEYIEICIANVKFWAKAFAEETRTDLRKTWCKSLNEAEEALAAEGWDWDDIEALEF